MRVKPGFGEDVDTDIDGRTGFVQFILRIHQIISSDRVLASNHSADVSISFSGPVRSMRR